LLISSGETSLYCCVDKQRWGVALELRSIRMDDTGIPVRLKATTIAEPKPTSCSRVVHDKLTVAQLDNNSSD
jgi:hypothetical protein